MARYIVIEVEDNQVAENLIAAFNEKTRAGWAARVVGLFVKPGATCACQSLYNEGAARGNYRENKAKHGWSGGVERGEKFGWWVCTVCNKPRKAGHTLVNQLLASQTFSELSPRDPDWEFTVDGLGIGSIHKANIDRPKKLRKRKK